jgi:hypothetical protein
MASIRENGRYGTALLIVGISGPIIAGGLALGCVSTDEPLFDEVAVPELRPNDRIEAPSAALPAEAPGADGTVPSEEQPSQALVLAMPDVAPAATSTPAAPPLAPPPEPVPPFQPCAGTGLLLCDTFEDHASDTFPVGPWLPELSSCGTHRVDGSGTSVSGAKSLRADAGGYPECMLHAELGSEAEVYLRSWVRLGPEPDLRAQYLSLLELGPRVAQDDPELRIGLRPAGMGGLCPALPGLDVSVSGLQSGSQTSCSGFALEPERWYCLQAHVKRESRRLDYELSVDGVSVLSASDVRLGNAWNDQSWYFKVGRAAYGQSPIGSVWHDDVAVGREPLPCGP